MEDEKLFLYVIESVVCVQIIVESMYETVSGGIRNLASVHRNH